MASVGSRPSELLGFPSSRTGLDSRCAIPLRAFWWLLGLGGNRMRSALRAEDPGTVCARYPRFCHLFSLPTPANASRSPALFTSVAVSPGQPPGHALPPPQNSASLGALCTPSTRNSISLWAFASLPFGVPRCLLCTLSPQNSMSPGTLAHASRRIPCPSRPLSTPSTQNSRPQTHAGPLTPSRKVFEGLI